MQVTVEKAEPCLVTISVEVEPEAVEKALSHVFDEIGRRLTVPGFRKGRAPRAVLERVVDPQAVTVQAAEHLMSEYYGRAVRDHGLAPVASPDVQAEDLVAGRPFRFTAIVPTRPEVQLCDYGNLPVRRRPARVTEQDVDVALDALFARAERLEKTDEQVAGSQMVATVDLNLYRGERRLGSRSRTDVAVDMDDTRSMPAFNLAMEGMRLGETRELVARYPSDHRDAVLAGKEIRHEITLTQLERKVSLERTDEAARSVFGAESLEQLRARVRADAEHTARETADEEARQSLIEQVVARSEVCFPEVLVQDRVAQAMRDHTIRLDRAGLTLEEYLRAQGTDRPTFERALREDARRRIRTQLVLETIAEKEGLEATPEEVAAELERLAVQSGVPVATARATFERQGDAVEGLKMQIRYRKVMDALLARARIMEE